MTCLDERTLRRWLAGALSPDVGAEVEQHVAGCDTCSKLLSELDTAAGHGWDRTNTDPQLAQGGRLGRYLLIEELGRGGMGKVYSAYDPGLDRKVALKLLRGSFRDPGGSQARLWREAQAMARLSHPNVVTVYAVEKVDDRLFLAMELVDGSTLKQWLAERSRYWREILQAYMEAGRGLAAAHAAGLIHRDFKPANVLVSRDGRIRVTDFGLAAASGPQEGGTPDPDAPGATGARRPAPSVLTQDGVIMGTPGYTAPEQVEGERGDPRTDQFSFCVALYEALYGERPFAGKTFTEVTASMVARPIPEPPRHSSVPARIRRIVLRGLSLSPEGRYPSMDKLLDELGRDPAAVWRRVLAGGAVLALVGALAYMALGRPPPAPACEDAARKLTGAWDESRRAAIRTAFLATGKPFALDAWNGAERILGEYATTWAAQHEEHCQAARVEGGQSEKLLLRALCLERRRTELRALTDLLAQADAKTVERAVEAAHALTPLDGCRSAAGLSAPLRLPENQAERAQVEEVRARLSEVKVLYDAGRYKQGLELAEKVLPLARKTQHRPVEAEALELLGRLQEKSGANDAEKSLEEAIWAAEATGHDEVAVRAATVLVRYLGYIQHRYEAAERWQRYATAVLQRLGQNEALRASLLHETGTMALAMGKLEDALTHYRQAQAIRERLLGPRHPETARTVNNVGVVLIELGDYPGAALALEQALEINRKSLGPEHPNIAISIVGRAEVHHLQGNDALSAEQLEEAMKLFDLNVRPEQHAYSVTMMIAAKAYAGDRKHDRAQALAERALAVTTAAVGPDNPRVAEALLALGEVQVARGEHRKALSSLEKAVAIWTRTHGADHPQIAESLTRLGEAYLGLRSPAKAVAPLERALRSQTGARTKPDELARTRLALAQALWSRRKGEDRSLARKLASEAREGYAAIGHRPGLARVEAWLAAHGKG